MSARIIQGQVTGTEQPSDYWQDVLLPVIKVNAPKPCFFESGYASGHANELLCVPGLLEAFKALQAEEGTRQASWTNYKELQSFRYGHGWCRVEWTNAKSSVFLTNNAAGQTDVYHMSN